MTLDFDTPGKVIVTMLDYVNGILSKAPDDMDGISNTPAAGYLFETRDNAKKLDEKKAVFFHYLTAKLLFLCKQARPDIQTAVAFLGTRVREPDEDDYKKLGRVVCYLRGSKDMPLTLEGKNPILIKWFVDGSFATHPNMKSHTGATMTMGSGLVYSTSVKQKINTKSSTEAELVAVNDVLGQILWTRYFIQSQGYDTKPSKLMQDNKSAIILESNGRSSS